MADAAPATSLIVDESTRAALVDRALDWPSATLDDDQRSELELLLGGALAPRRGWTAQAPLQVRLTGTAETAQGQQQPTTSGHVVLRDAEGVALAVLDVAAGSDEGDGIALSGDVRGLALPVHHDLTDLRATAAEVATGLAHHDRVVGVLVTRPLHPADVELVAAASGDDAVLLVVAAVDHLDRFALARSLPPAVAALGTHRTTTVLVPESGWLAEHLQDPRAEHDLVARHGATDVLPRKRLARDVHARVVELVGGDATVPDDLGWPEGVAELRHALRPNRQRGLVVFFTGLSGSGKSTVAQVVAARLREAGEREVTLLDGDVVRTHLSAGLGFSPEDRDRNVRRIGWVAAEIGRHGGTTIACPIAPYDAARRANRAAAENAGTGFVLVHVATPLAVCEERDRKGLYAKARAGLITGFTGIDAPYEAPTDAEVVVDTTDLSAPAAAQAVLDHLRSEGWIG